METQLIAHRVCDEGMMGCKITVTTDDNRPPSGCPGLGGWKLERRGRDFCVWWTRVKGQVGSALLQASCQLQ